jgi:hypothetical protein
VNTGPFPFLVVAALMPAAVVTAQPLGTFRWQLQPFCNVITVTVTQVGSLYRVEGRDDRCGAARQGSVIGTAFLNPDGTIGMGLNVVSVPDGRPEPVAAVLSLATLNGTWSGASTAGQYVFTPGAGSGGVPRPAPAEISIPALFSLNTDGAFLAGGTFGVGTIPASGAGERLMWHPAKAAVRAGRVTGMEWNDESVGNSSAAFNSNTRATGAASFAVNASTLASGFASMAVGTSTSATQNQSFASGLNSLASGMVSFATGSGTTASGAGSFSGGSGTTASGQHAVALGQGTNALGGQSVALGLNTSATGAHAMAMGDGAIASGGNSLAVGANSQANGFESVALGLRVLAGGNGAVVLGSDALALAAAPGSFIFGDRSTTTDLTAFIPNQFLARAAGGVGFYTNPAMSIGVELAPNGSQWLAVSDVNAKQTFRDLDGEDVLTKLAAMPIQTWSYKAQGDRIRHVGPTAQDFAAAFGLGEDPLRIGTVDADGIALRAIQALEARTRQLGDAERDRQRLIERLSVLEREVARLQTQGPR